MTPPTSSGRSVALFVRSLSPTEPPAPRHVERVRQLEASGRVAEAAVTVWGREVELSARARRAPTDKCVLDRVADFRAWADERDVSMEPFFETREVSSSLSGEEFATLRLPVTCLAEYEDDELAHVAPYVADGAVCSVADRLATFEGAQSDPDDGTDGRERAPIRESDAVASPATLRIH